MGQARCCLSATSNKMSGQAAFADGRLATGSPENVTLSKGKIQDRYMIGKVLGYGAFGEIRKIKDKKT